VKTRHTIFLEKKMVTFSAPLIFLVVFLIFQFNVKAKEKGVIINEIKLSGGKGKTNEDYVELYNPLDKPLQIGAWNLRKRTQSGKESSIKVFSKEAVIPAKGYFLWANNEIASLLAADEASSAYLSSNNSVALLDEHDEIIDQVAWGSGHENPFIEKAAVETIAFVKDLSEIITRTDFGDSDNNFDDFVVTKKESPEASGCQETVEKCKIQATPRNYPTELTITELFPNPFSSQYEEYIELYNGSTNDIDLSGWSLHDASKSGQYVFPANVFIQAKQYLAIFKKDFKFALNNSGSESVTLFDPNGKEISKARYDGSKKDVSYNFDNTSWRWSKILTPGKENIFNNLPYGTLKVDDEVFVDVYADFFISTGDLDNEKVKVVWDFGDGHKSYVVQTRHKYEKTGKYDASVTLSDESEEVMKKFEVEVVEYAHPKIKIIAIKANPQGKDAGTESIIIQNKSKKKINLKGWSIATGWKKMINHVIKENVYVKRKNAKEITNAVASFSLNNTKAKIQLRYPDGKIASEVKYKKKEGIADNEEYRKVKGGWKWVGAVESQKPIKSIKQKEEIIWSSVSGPSADEASNQSSETMNADEYIVEENSIEENFVPFESKKENKFVSFTNEDINIELFKNDFHSNGIVIVREEEGEYYFTRRSDVQEHYAKAFLKDLYIEINKKITLFINKI
jgi:hypothetical protein